MPAGPGRTNLKPGEILVSFTLPPRPPGSSDAYLRMIPRTEMDIAVVGVGVSLTIKDGTVTAARVGLGAVAPTVLLVEDAAKALIGSQARRRRAGESRRRLFRRLPSDRRQARHHRLSHQSGRRAAQAHRRHRRQTRYREMKFMAKVHVTTTINGEPMEFLCEPIDTMLDALRGPLALTGSKEGCASGDCGACSITLDDQPDLLLPDARGRSRRPRDPHHRGHGATATSCIRCSRSFWKWPRCNAASAPRACWSPPTRCCKRNPNPSEEEVRFWLAGNLCRCTGYDKIVRAVMDTAAEMRAQ